MSAKYEPQVETNLRTRVTPTRLGKAADWLTYQLQATDVEAAYAPNVIAELEAMRDRLYGLADETAEYVEDKKAAAKAAPKPKADEKPKAAKKGKRDKAPVPESTFDPKTLTVAELKEFYRIRTGTPAPSKWNKKALIEAAQDVLANDEAA